MPWVRIHDNAMQDLKIASLSDSAFRLWVRGLSYCQTALTDGLIPEAALRQMGAKPKDVKELAAARVPGRAPLWETVLGFGFKVHDYLDWNESREKVLAEREKARRRQAAWRRSHGGSNDVTDDERDAFVTGAHSTPHHPNGGRH